MDCAASDEEFMRRALELARATAALASPNPMVGCVVVRDGEIVGEGAHLYDSIDHAEVIALAQAGERAHKATAYVTLEPCSHQGRTGPCADALIAAGVSRVVVATIDPNPLVRGQGIGRLRAAGIDVTVGLLQDEARQINAAFARFIRTGRPLVTLKAALSADGMLAPPDVVRLAKEPFWLTGDESRAEVQRMRHASDAVLTGIGTVLADDPLLTDRSGLSRRRRLLRVVLDSHLRTPLDSHLVRSSTGDVLLFCSKSAALDRVAALQAAGVEVALVAQLSGRLNLDAVLATLGSRQIQSVLLEGGSELNGEFLAHDQVDRVALFYAPEKLGAGALSFASGVGSPFQLEQSLDRLRRLPYGADTCVTGELRDPWS